MRAGEGGGRIRWRRHRRHVVIRAVGDCAMWSNDGVVTSAGSQPLSSVIHSKAHIVPTSVHG